MSLKNKKKKPIDKLRQIFQTWINLLNSQLVKSLIFSSLKIT